MMEEAEESNDTAMMDKGMEMMQVALDNAVEAAEEESLGNGGEAAEEEAGEEEAPAVLVKSGEFKDADAFHKGSGQAIVYQGPDGSHLLRLENLGRDQRATTACLSLGTCRPGRSRGGPGARLLRPGNAEGEPGQPELSPTF